MQYYVSKNYATLFEGAERDVRRHDNNSSFTNHLHFVNQPDRGFPRIPPEGTTP